MPRKKWKPENARVTKYSPPVIFFRSRSPFRTKMESSSYKILQNSVENTHCVFLFYLQGIELHIYRNWIVQHVALTIIKKLFLGIYSIDHFTQKQPLEVFKVRPATLFKRDFNTVIFLWTSKNYKNTYCILKNVCKWLLFCTCPVSSTIIFWIHTELLRDIQLLLLCDILCVIFVDNKDHRGLQLHKLQLNFHILKILEIHLDDVKIWKRNWRVLIHIVSQQFLLKFI